MRQSIIYSWMREGISSEVDMQLYGWDGIAYGFTGSLSTTDGLIQVRLYRAREVGERCSSGEIPTPRMLSAENGEWA